MGRKKKTRFQMIREDIDEEPVEFAVRPNRNAERRLQGELDELAWAVANLPPSKRAALTMDDSTRREVDLLIKAGNDGGRRRQLKRVTGLLRVMDLDNLRDELDGNTANNQRMHDLERWRSRILADGDDAIQAFVDVHEGVDRVQIRALARQAEGESDAATRASRKLFQALKKARPLPDPAPGEAPAVEPSVEPAAAEVSEAAPEAPPEDPGGTEPTS